MTFLRKRRETLEANGFPPEKRGLIADEWFECTERIKTLPAPIRSLVLSALSPLLGMRVLEVGCGMGALTVELLREVGERGRVVSLELLPAASTLARMNVERSGFDDRSQIIQGKAPRYIPEARYDVALICAHGEELEAVMATCWERLETNGRLLLMSTSPGTTHRALSYFDVLGAHAAFWRVHASVGAKQDVEWFFNSSTTTDLIWGDK